MGGDNSATYIQKAAVGCLRIERPQREPVGPMSVYRTPEGRLEECTSLRTGRPMTRMMLCASYSNSMTNVRNESMAQIERQGWQSGAGGVRTLRSQEMTVAPPWPQLIGKAARFWQTRPRPWRVRMKHCPLSPHCRLGRVAGRGWNDWTKEALLRAAAAKSLASCC